MHICPRLIVLTLLIFLAGCSRSLPPAEVVFEKPPTTYHIVKSGESLASIASLYGMDKNELTRLNGLKPPYRLVTGQRLLVTSQGSTVNQQPIAEGGYETSGITVQPLQPPSGIEEAASTTPTPGTLGEEEKTSLPKEEEDEGEPSEKPIPASTGQMVWPVQGKIIKNFSSNGEKRGNDGINIAAPKGTPVKAADSGVVVRSGNQLSGFGNFILIKHDSDLITVYTHLDTIAEKFKNTKGKGIPVERGETIGTVGLSGQVKEPQIHFEVRRGKTPIDPQPLLQ